MISPPLSLSFPLFIPFPLPPLSPLVPTPSSVPFLLPFFLSLFPIFPPFFTPKFVKIPDILWMVLLLHHHGGFLPKIIMFERLHRRYPLIRIQTKELIEEIYSQGGVW